MCGIRCLTLQCAHYVVCSQTHYGGLIVHNEAREEKREREGERETCLRKLPLGWLLGLVSRHVHNLFVIQGQVLHSMLRA